MTKEDAVAGIAATVTYQGLKCTAVLDEADYPGGAEISDDRMRHLEDRVLDRGRFHGEWNYTSARPRPARNQNQNLNAGPGRVPRAVLNHPALTGVPARDMTALAAALQPQFEARLQLQLPDPARLPHHRRPQRHPARQPAARRHRPPPRAPPPRHLNLPCEAVGALLGIDPSTASRATALAREPSAQPASHCPAPRQPGNSPAPQPSSSPTPPQGIPLTIPENGTHARPLQKHTDTRPPATRPGQPSKKRGITLKIHTIMPGEGAAAMITPGLRQMWRALGGRRPPKVHPH